MARRLVNEKTKANHLLKMNSEFRKLFKDHQNLDQRLIELDRNRFLTSIEEFERKKVQKQKLECKDRMEEILRDHSVKEISAT